MGQEHDLVRRVDGDLLVFNMGDEKEGGKWNTSAEQGGMVHLGRGGCGIAHEEMAQPPSGRRRKKRGGGGGGQQATAEKMEAAQQGSAVRRETSEKEAGKDGCGGGGSVTALAQMREWQAERVARHVAD